MKALILAVMFLVPPPSAFADLVAIECSALKFKQENRMDMERVSKIGSSVALGGSVVGFVGMMYLSSHLDKLIASDTRVLGIFGDIQRAVDAKYAAQERFRAALNVLLQELKVMKLSTTGELISLKASRLGSDLSWLDNEIARIGSRQVDSSNLNRLLQDFRSAYLSLNSAHQNVEAQTILARQFISIKDSATKVAERLNRNRIRNSNNRFFFRTVFYSASFLNGFIVFSTLNFILSLDQTEEQILSAEFERRGIECLAEHFSRRELAAQF